MKSWDGFSIKEWYNCHPICIIYQHLRIKKAIQPQKNGFLPVKEQLRDWEKKQRVGDGSIPLMNGLRHLYNTSARWESCVATQVATKARLSGKSHLGFLKDNLVRFCSTCYLLGETQFWAYGFLWFSYGFPMVLCLWPQGFIFWPKWDDSQLRHSP